mgnify:CR=1 FL=1|jgi:ankyrin repeat protein
MNARDGAENLGQNLDVFDLRNHLIDEESDKFLSKLKASPTVASTPLDTNDGEVLLSVAIRCNNTECATALIDSGANINLMNNMLRKSILLEAIECKLFDLVRYLIKNGAKSDHSSVGDYGRYLSPKYAQDGFLSKTEYESLIDNIKKGTTLRLIFERLTRQIHLERKKCRSAFRC